MTRPHLILAVAAVAVLGAAFSTIFVTKVPNSEAEAAKNNNNCSNNYSGDFSPGEA